eukprot:CAMPEP_0184497190 /NCGR_PEP_ID=MMETSP0113_2-20130426/35891_1 /TAXON_ID=91329 /ORGANISM="Norrisiella sphaerica, Strain BC52" /LENGTH=499 /DNA_ID=CAMNT_0026884181 /DNA_START=9 /DNA_END=1508 /DNA_ORIENTATION=+
MPLDRGTKYASDVFLPPYFSSKATKHLSSLFSAALVVMILAFVFIATVENHPSLLFAAASASASPRPGACQLETSQLSKMKGHIPTRMACEDLRYSDGTISSADLACQTGRSISTSRRSLGRGFGIVASGVALGVGDRVQAAGALGKILNPSGVSSQSPAVVDTGVQVLGSGSDALEIRSVVNGLWQVSGAHGKIDGAKAIAEMFKYVDAGLTTWDAADHYGPAELITREFRKQYRQLRGQEPPIQVFTKYVPRPGDMPYELIEAAVDSRLNRLGVQQIDLLQFHWWDYSNTQYIEAMKHMKTLKEKGKIRNLALTNFDTDHMRELVETYHIPLVSNQVQFSLLDRRPLNKMTHFAAKHDIKLLAYGVLCGGLLTDKYLGVRDPSDTIDTASKQKYWYGTINEWGDWDLFQKLLKTLRNVGDRHGGVSIANVAQRYILDQPQVAGVIIGARLSRATHIDDNLRVYNLKLQPKDFEEIDAVLNQGRMLRGDCGDEYRRYY